MSFNTRTCCGRSSSCLHPRPASSRCGRPLGPLCSPSARPRKGKPSRVGGDPCLSPRGCLGRHCTGPPSSARHPFLRGDWQTPHSGQRQQTRGRLPNESARRGRVSSVPAVPDSPFSPALVTVRPGSPAPQRSARHGLSVPSRTGVKGPGDPGTRPSPRPHRSFSPPTHPTPPPPSSPGSNRRRGLFRLRWGVERRDRAAA